MVVRIKSVCKKAGIGKFDGGPKGATVQFYNDRMFSDIGVNDIMILLFHSKDT